LAEEAKAEQNDLRCRTVFDEAQRQLNDGKGDAVGKLISSSQTKCSGLAALRPKAADLVFKEGLEAYKKTQMPAALQKFRAALVIQPDHDLAAQYLALTEGKLELTAERALLAWRKDFDARDFVAAARDYQELSSLSGAQTMAEVRMEYRRVLSELVDYSNRACAGNDTAGVEKIRTQINALLPDPSLGDGILSRLTTCAPPPRASAPAGCIHMDSQYALTRLKSRVDPQFPPAVRSQIKIFPVNVSVKARIDEKGNVVSGEPQGGSPLMYPAIRAAVDQWKFFPAIIDGEGVRCVETEIPFVINVAN
jgi:hypothetical protein